MKVYSGSVDCSQCLFLTTEYESLERAYAAAVTELNTGIKSAPVEEYRRLRKRADESRLDAEVARLELEKHRRSHPKAD
jgi:hypothetical protein